jgi:PAS domain S-box-containing protein
MASAPDFMQGGGEMGALMRAYAWSASTLGAPATWPPPLQTAVGLLLSSEQPMYIWWGSDLLCFYNDAYRQSIGAERHPGSLGKPGREVWSEIWPIIGPQIEQVISGRGGVSFRNALVPITRNGRLEEVYWTYTYNPLFDPATASGVGGVLVICTETTEQVRADAALQESEARFRDIADATPVLIWISDARKTCTWFNSRWLAFTGRTLEQESGYGWVEGVHPDDLERCVSVYNDAFDRREAYRTEYRRRRVDGQWRTLDASGVPRLVDGVFVGYIGCCIDVTDQKDAARALSDSEEQLRLATDAAEVGLWDVDLATDTLYWPARVKSMFGISPDVPVSMSDFYAGLHAHDRERVVAALDAAANPAERALYDVEYRTVGREDGIVRWLAAKGRGIFRDDRCVRVIGTAIDITTRKASEAQLRELNERLEHRVAEVLAERKEAEKHIYQAQKIDAIGQLTGGVAHDFNNLLMVISGGLSLLQLSGDSLRRERIIGQMRQAADRGASLSRQLLAFARRQPLKSAPVDLYRTLDGMRELLDRTLRGDVQVKTELAAGLWPVHVDSAQLELVILNLCVNARDAMPQGGVITVGAKNVAHAKENDLPGDFVSLYVTDTGTGMSAEILARIFEPFFTTKEVGKGSGMGLPQVYGFAQQSGGNVKVETTEGAGTTVTLLLPRSELLPPRDEPAAKALDTTARRQALKGSVLLVEDDDEVAALVTEMLRELGFRVTRVPSAQSALGALADDPGIDLVFSDVMMPGAMNGVELAREVRRRRPATPVLLTTGYAGTAFKTAAAEGIEVLAKPYEISQLGAALAAALGSARVDPK